MSISQVKTPLLICELKSDLEKKFPCFCYRITNFYCEEHDSPVGLCLETFMGKAWYKECILRAYIGNNNNDDFNSIDACFKTEKTKSKEIVKYVCHFYEKNKLPYLL